MFDFSYEVKDLFLDVAEIQKRIGYARARVLRKQGGFVRTRVKTRVLRRRKTSAMPGQPPRIHSSGGLQRVLYFYDPSTETVVVGSVKLPGKQSDAVRLMEHGGKTRIKKRTRGGRIRGTVPARYRGNPYMIVGLKEEIAAGTIPKAWDNMVRG